MRYKVTFGITQYVDAETGFDAIRKAKRMVKPMLGNKLWGDLVNETHAVLITTRRQPSNHVIRVRPAITKPEKLLHNNIT